MIPWRENCKVSMGGGVAVGDDFAGDEDDVVGFDDDYDENDDVEIHGWSGRRTADSCYHSSKSLLGYVCVHHFRVCH